MRPGVKGGGCEAFHVGMWRGTHGLGTLYTKGECVACVCEPSARSWTSEHGVLGRKGNCVIIC